MRGGGNCQTANGPGASKVQKGAQARWTYPLQKFLFQLLQSRTKLAFSLLKFVLERLKNSYFDWKMHHPSTCLLKKDRRHGPMFLSDQQSSLWTPTPWPGGDVAGSPVSFPKHMVFPFRDPLKQVSKDPLSGLPIFHKHSCIYAHAQVHEGGGSIFLRTSKRSLFQLRGDTELC